MTSSPPSARGGRPLAPWLLLALCLPVFFYGLADYSIVNDDEAFYHYVAREMVRSGNWLRLVFVGEHRVYDTFMNAPWQYWIKASLITLLGDGAWSMRLLSAVCGVGTVWITYRLAASLAGTAAGLLAGLVQLTTLQFVHIHGARTGELDAALSFLFALIAYLFLRALETGRSFIPHHVCLALLLGIKLPVIAIPLAVELAFLALCPWARRRWRDWLRTALWVLPLGLVWHVGQALVQWDDFVAALSRMQDQATQSRRAEGLLERLRVNGLFYARTLVFGAWPWVAVYPFALYAGLRRATRAERERWGLLALFAAGVFGFFLLVAKKYSWYILPAYPFLSAFTGLWLARLLRERPGFAALLAVACVLAGIAWIKLEISDFNPYAQIAARAPMQFSLRSVAGVGPGAGIPLGIALAFGLLIGVRRATGTRPAAIGGALLALLLGLAGWRTLRPLANTHHQSEMERTSRALHDARARGERIAFPVTIHERGVLKVRYYFADEYRIEEVRSGRDLHYLLYPKTSD